MTSQQADVYVAVCGAEGVGKTHLVQELYEKYRRTKPVGSHKLMEEKTPDSCFADGGAAKDVTVKDWSNKAMIPPPGRFSYNSVDMIRITTPGQEGNKEGNNYVLVDSPSALDSEIINGGALFASDIAVFLVDVKRYATHFELGSDMVGKVGKQEGHEVHGAANKTKLAKRQVGHGESARQLLQVFASGLKHMIFLFTGLDAEAEAEAENKATYERVVESITSCIHSISKQKIRSRSAADRAAVDGGAEAKLDFVCNGAPKENQGHPGDSYATFVPFTFTTAHGEQVENNNNSHPPPHAPHSHPWYSGPADFLEALDQQRDHYEFERSKTRKALEKPGTRTGFRLQALHAFNLSSSGSLEKKVKMAGEEKNESVRGASPKKRYMHGRGNCSGGVANGFTYASNPGGKKHSSARTAEAKFGAIVHPSRNNYFAEGVAEKDAGITVLCGRVLSGAVTVGDEVGLGPFPDFHEIPPFKCSNHRLLSEKLGSGAGPIVAVVKSIKWFDVEVESAQVGQMVGLAFSTADIERGVYHVPPYTKDEMQKMSEADDEKPPKKKKVVDSKRATALVSSKRPLENLKFSKMTRNLRLHKGIVVGKIRELGLPSQVQRIRLHILNFAPGGDLKASRRFLMVSGGSATTQVTITKIHRVLEPKTGRTITNGTIMDTIPPGLAAELEVTPEGPLYVDNFRFCRMELTGQHLGRVYLLDQHFVVAVGAVLDTTSLWADQDFFLITMVLRRIFPFELVHKLLGYTSKKALKPFGPHAF